MKHCMKQVSSNGIDVTMYPTLRSKWRVEKGTTVYEMYYVTFRIDGLDYRHKHAIGHKGLPQFFKRLGLDYETLAWQEIDSPIYSKPPWYASWHGKNGVYFVEAVNAGLVKIGQSQNVTSRINSMTNFVPYPLRLLFVLPGRRDEERDYHKKFRQQHHHGEWFRIEGELEEFIKTHVQNS